MQTEAAGALSPLGPTDGPLLSEELQLAFRNRGMPLEAMRYDLTPTGLHYLVVHWDIPPVDPATWRLTIGGRVREPLELTLDAIRTRPRQTIPVTLECAGNGRGWLTPRPVSLPWLGEAIGTAEWTGTPLAGLLEEAGLEAAAVEVVFRGSGRQTDADDPGEPVRRMQVRHSWSRPGSPTSSRADAVSMPGPSISRAVHGRATGRSSAWRSPWTGTGRRQLSGRPWAHSPGAVGRSSGTRPRVSTSSPAVRPTSLGTCSPRATLELPGHGQQRRPARRRHRALTRGRVEWHRLRRSRPDRRPLARRRVRACRLGDVARRAGAGAGRPA
jgi:hypothetical protein